MDPKEITKAIASSYLQVIFKVTFWIRYWSLLQKEEDYLSVRMGCRIIETTAMEVFCKARLEF
jgi:hypothetical protein